MTNPFLSDRVKESRAQGDEEGAIRLAKARKMFRRRPVPFLLYLRAQSLDGKKATMVAYIDARDVMKMLDEVAGPEHWKDEYQVLDEAGQKVKYGICPCATRSEASRCHNASSSKA